MDVSQTEEAARTSISQTQKCKGVWCAQIAYEGESSVCDRLDTCVQVSSSRLVFGSMDTRGSKSKFRDISLNSSSVEQGLL